MSSADDMQCPCPHGGFVYLFSDDPTHYDPRDCFFHIDPDAPADYQPQVCNCLFPASEIRTNKVYTD